MAISRMQEPQQIQRGLGSLDVPRQNYGLGKLVKKAVRGVKKIAKSPLGKAALLYAGTAGLGALGGGGFKGLGWLKPSQVMSNWGSSGILGKLRSGKGMLGGFGNMFRQDPSNIKSKFSMGKMLMGGLGAASLAAPFFMKGDEEEDVVEEAWTSVPSSIADIRNQARNYYTNPSESTLAFMPGKQFVNPNFYAADGGRAGLLNGGEAGQAQIEQMLMAEFVKYKNQGGKLTFEQFVQAVMQAQQQPEGAGMEQPQEVAMANGGSVPGSTVPGYTTPAGHNRFDYYSGGDPVRVGAYAGGRMNEDDDEYNYNPYAAMRMYKRAGKQEGGIMETEEASEMIDMGGQEKDYRETGGFVEIGGKERADDVPARLSKNEFVFTADAVRAAGGGDIDAGSEVMQNMMDNLEAGGEISEESQGLEGAQAMYDQQQMLQSRIA
jgi:hypothetical protein